jgi:signal transduction histidine kinase
VTIRRLLLLSFLLVSLVPAVALTVMAFLRTQEAMQGEIEQGVLRSAASVSAEVDKLLYERMLNLTTWNHLEVMEDLRIDDVDKRLSAFLSEMKRRYGGVYLALHAVDGTGRIVASSDAERIGQRYAAEAPWHTAELPGGRVRFDEPVTHPSDGRRSLAVRSAVDSRFTGETIGDLVLEIEWSELQRVLDQVSDASRQAIVLEENGEVVAASTDLLQRGVAAGSVLSGWLPPSPLNGIEQRAGPPLSETDVIVGRQHSRGAGTFSGFGWTTLLLQSSTVAFAPVRKMAWTFAGLLAVTIAAIIAVAYGVAARIAKPVVALTEYTRRYTQPGTQPDAPPLGPGEIGELNRSFVRMVEDLQRSQQTLVQASKLAALGEVTALMAHEVRTPLGILRSSAQMLRAEKALSAETAELLRIIESETERLNRLVGSMLDSTRTRPPQLQAMDVHALIAHAARLLAAQLRDRGVTLTLNCMAPRAIAECDAEQMTQVLLNLMTNAVLILPRGGRIEVATRNEEGRLVIEVADDGPGIPPQERGRIFEPFVYKREGGVGLGLAVVRQIVRQHGGDVAADASPLGGALFRVRLPQQESRIP